MNLLNQFINFIKNFLDFISSIYMIIYVILFILICYILIYFLKDRKSIKTFMSFEDSETISLEDLKINPLVNIIVPAWKEGYLFKDCLLSIENLSYPNIKAIVNAGGNEETLEIANSFKKKENFIILYQIKGADRPSLGKIKAINECLNYVSEGIIYFIDADSYLTDEILLRMIYPIINLNENMVVGGVRPLEKQKKKPLVKYLMFDRFYSPKTRFSRHVSTPPITGQSFCLKYEVQKSIGRFTEHKKFATDRSMGIDVYSKDFSSYVLYDYQHRIFVDYSASISELIHQKTIWIENSLIFSYKHKKFELVKFIVSYFISLYLFLFPLFLFIHFGLFFIGLMILLNLYLQKIRKLLFFISVNNHEFYEKYGVGFFIKLVFYIYIETAIVIRIPFHFWIFLKKLRK